MELGLCRIPRRYRPRPNRRPQAAAAQSRWAQKMGVGHERLPPAPSHSRQIRHETSDMSNPQSGIEINYSTPKFCLTCQMHVAPQHEGICPRCGGRNFVFQTKSHIPTSTPKNYANTNLLISKLWQTYLMAFPIESPYEISPLHVHEMLELADFAHFIIGEIKLELEKENPQ